jgi:pimeloyl-ACP methyl ester carboxylesterase
MGCLATLLVGEGAPPMARAYPFERYVLVSAPNRFTEVAREFGEGLGLSRAAQRAYERHLGRLAHRSLADFTGAKLLAATGRPALLLHSRDDREVLYRNAEEIGAACAGAELVPFDGLGHRAILYAPPVIRAAVAYLAEP